MKDRREIVPTHVDPVVDLERPFEPQIVPGTGRYPAYQESYGQEGFQILDYWRAIRKRLWLVVGIAVLITTLAAIYVARKPNIYLANAQIQVDLEQTNPDLVTSDRQRALPTQDPAYFNTQLQLLGSDTILRRVIKEHSLDSNKDFQQALAESSGSGVRGMLRAIGLASDPSTNTETNSEGDSLNSNLISADEIAEARRLAPYVEIIRRGIGVEPVRESRAR